MFQNVPKFTKMNNLDGFWKKYLQMSEKSCTFAVAKVLSRKNDRLGAEQNIKN